MIELDDIDALLARVKMQHSPIRFGPMRASRMSMSCPHGEIIVPTYVPDRETGIEIAVTFQFSIPPYLRCEAEFYAWLGKELQSIFVHEFREAFHVDGVRLLDPHARDWKHEPISLGDPEMNKIAKGIAKEIAKYR